MIKKITRQAFLFFILITLLIPQILVQTGCANIIPPQGGLRDSIPPLLIKANPGDSTKNFTGKRITFSFDEFVNVENVYENLIVSPTPNITPGVDYKLNTVTVKLKDTLEPNTTYSLNFGNAIKDVNENNVLRNFTYIFSTGNYIDSMELHGKVILAETGKTDSTLIVMLHTSSDDSAVIKNKPRYVAKLDSSGNFTFRNLPPATYYLYALKDEGGNRRYFDDKQLFAFADKPVTVQEKTEPVTLYAYASKEKETTTTTTTNTKQPQTSTTLQGLNLGNRNRPGAAAAEKRLRFQTNLTNNQQDLLGDFIMTFDQPLRLFDSSKVSLSIDSTFTPVSSYRFVKDSSNKKLQLTQTWKENTVYHLILDKDFADDSSGKKLLKTDTLTFTTNKSSDYGVLKIKFLNLNLSTNPVLLFITNNTIFKSFPLSSADFSQPLFLPGEYELRILYDANKNGVWDAGEFFGKHQQPEIVKPISRRISIKKSWENEFDIPAPSNSP
jgi:Bacterial Ig-like domain